MSECRDENPCVTGLYVLCLTQTNIVYSSQQRRIRITFVQCYEDCAMSVRNENSIMQV